MLGVESVWCEEDEPKGGSVTEATNCQTLKLYMQQKQLQHACHHTQLIKKQHNTNQLPQPTCVLRLVLEGCQQHHAGGETKGAGRHHAPLPAKGLAQRAWWE